MPELFKVGSASCCRFQRQGLRSRTISYPILKRLRCKGGFPTMCLSPVADLIMLSYFHTYRTPVAVTRCGNLFGGGDSTLTASFPVPFGRRCRRGAYYPQRRDYIRDYFYVRDAGEAYLQRRRSCRTLTLRVKPSTLVRKHLFPFWNWSIESLS